MKSANWTFFHQVARFSFAEWIPLILSGVSAAESVASGMNFLLFEVGKLKRFGIYHFDSVVLADCKKVYPIGLDPGRSIEKKILIISIDIMLML